MKIRQKFISSSWRSILSLFITGPLQQVGLSPYEMLYGILRESFPRQVDRESRGPQGERGLEFSRRKKGQTFFSFSTLLRII